MAAAAMPPVGLLPRSGALLSACSRRCSRAVLACAIAGLVSAPLLGAAVAEAKPGPPAHAGKANKHHGSKHHAKKHHAPAKHAKHNGSGGSGSSSSAAGGGSSNSPSSQSYFNVSSTGPFASSSGCTFSDSDPCPDGATLPLTKSSWVQPGDLTDIFSGEVSYMRPTACDVSDPTVPGPLFQGELSVTVLVDGSAAGVALVDSNPQAAGQTETVPIDFSSSDIAPNGSRQPHQFEVQVRDGCLGAGQHYLIQAVAISVDQLP
jgi:hypothetical protein